MTSLIGSMVRDTTPKVKKLRPKRETQKDLAEILAASLKGAEKERKSA